MDTSVAPSAKTPENGITANAAPKISVKGVTKVFSSKRGEVTALKDLSLDIRDGEFLVIVGASGCGKSTLLNLVAGFDSATHGEVLLDGRPVTGITPECGMIFQQYALFPWKTVQENVEFGLKMKRMPKSEREERAAKFIELVGLNGFERTYPHHLSGGMKQRVSIARSLANDPQVMLLDEPFAALDAMTRQVLQEQLVRIYEKHRKTIIFITHSIDEALLLSSRIVVMTARPGRIAQEITNDLPHPRNADVQLSERYLELKRHIWSSVQAEVLKSMEVETGQ
ncbi:ABC transporter ATP-binding protein [Desulfococcus multivorans]|uniref:ABC transporter related protein n=1 Tax=Desulfococcus multivorans DSM 2059 TaxID=1121405 RepID=S7TRJ3_DESML|nr:ABC transporter ATP-binding protein [Desulfococcus multivorans]AOY57538.1 putative ABC transporter, ATP-binding protein [Desulfococcus multivorans]AQV02858.2 ATP-binding protein [Desulfococcus multivorans]EPR39285.1 ABC transporter related protein [Desulfococcus multivorans DSM 2059]SKA12099.1 NitT/TauT family transport system ATP-binding protein [Desulfococcus multivorans DSM 2059]